MKAILFPNNNMWVRHWGRWYVVTPEGNYSKLALGQKPKEQPSGQPS